MDVAGEKSQYLLSYQRSEWFSVGHEATRLRMKGWICLPRCCISSGLSKMVIQTFMTNQKIERKFRNNIKRNTQVTAHIYILMIICR